MFSIISRLQCTDVFNLLFGSSSRPSFKVQNVKIFEKPFVWSQNKKNGKYKTMTAKKIEDHWLIQIQLML